LAWPDRFCRDALRDLRSKETAPTDGAVSLCGVIAGHSRSKNGVASLACDPAIHHFSKTMDARIKSAHDDE
jgi:hypothetical protein